MSSDTPLDIEIPYCVDKPRPIPKWLNFLIGGTSGMLSRIIVHPADLVKTRLQLLDQKQAQRESAWSMARGIVGRKGFIGLYAGLSAALFRQGTYTTALFGIYSLLFDTYRDTCGTPGFGIKLMIGLVAGGIGAVIGNPSEVALIRMQADGRLPVAKRRNYKHIFNAFSRIVKEEGIKTLWRGTVPTVARGMLVNSAQLGTYSETKELLRPRLGDTVLLYFCSSVTAGIISIFVSLPIDIIKTRIQNDPKGHPSLIDVFMQIVKNEGPMALWTGFLPSFLKITPQAILIFIIFEELVSLYKKYAVEPSKCERLKMSKKKDQN